MKYSVDDYHNLIVEITNIEIEASSIAESRQILTELKKREKILIELRKLISDDIRSIELEYLKERRLIIEKYSPNNNNSGFLNILNRGSPRKNRTKEMKKFDKKKESQLDPYYNLKYQIDHLLEQIKEAKIAQSDYMKERFR